MLVEDVYAAAVDGDVQKLKDLIYDKDILNELWPAGVDPNGYARFQSVVFSILEEKKGDVDFDVLRVLENRGADFNTGMVYQKDGLRIVVPALKYALDDWHDSALVRVLLQCGADAGATTYSDFDGQSTPMLWYAISCWKSPRMMELLLGHHADPHACCVVSGQHLPLIYYTFIEERSPEKTQALFARGVTPDCAMNDGYGTIPFREYVRLSYPELSDELEDLYAGSRAKAAGTRKPVRAKRPASVPVRRSQEGYTSGIAEKAAAAAAAASAFVQENLPAVTEKAAQAANFVREKAGAAMEERRQKTAAKRLEPYHGKLFGKFGAYLFVNFALLFIAFGLIGPIIYWKSDREIAIIFFVISIPFFLISYFLWRQVWDRAVRSMYVPSSVMQAYVGTGVLIMGKILLCCTIILIPLVRWIGGDNFGFKMMKLQDGSEMLLRERDPYHGVYTDVMGNVYKDQNKPDIPA